jgi:hypothetical protein
MYTLHSCAKMHKLLIFLDTKCINNELVISTQSLTPAMKKLLYSYLVFVYRPRMITLREMTAKTILYARPIYEKIMQNWLWLWHDSNLSTSKQITATGLLF